MAGEPARGSLRRCELPEVLPHCFLGLRETILTVRVREREVVRIHPMCLPIRPLRDPALMIGGRFGLVSNESAHTTDGEQCRCDERLSYRNGRRFTCCLNDQCCKRHPPPLSFTARQILPEDRASPHGPHSRHSVGRSSTRLHLHRPRRLRGTAGHQGRSRERGRPPPFHTRHATGN